LRSSHDIASITARCPVHAETLGRLAHRQRRATSGTRVSGNLPTDFGFPHRRSRARAGKPFTLCPSRATRLHYPPEGKPARLSQQGPVATNGRALGKGLPQKGLLCERGCAMRWRWIRSTNAASIFGTTGGQVYCSADSGDFLESDRAAICRPVLFR